MRLPARVLLPVADQALIAAFNLALQLALLRFATPTDYGLFVLWQSLIMMMVGFQDAMIGVPLAVRITYDPANARRFVLERQLSSFAGLFVVAAACVGLVAVTLTSPGRASLTLAVAVGLYAACFMVYAATRFLCLSRMQFGIALVLDGSYAALSLAAVGILYAREGTITLAPLFFVLSAPLLVAAAITRLVMPRPPAFRLRRTLARYRPIWRDTRWTAAASFASELQNRAFVFVLTAVYGPAVMAGIFAGMLVLRLRAAYLALFTLGFSEILKATISAEIDITRGQAGLELPPLYPNGVNLFGTYFEPTDKLPPYYTMLALLLACLAILGWLARSKFGLFVRALREDQDAAAALGVNTTRYKVLVFTITCAMAAAAGAVQGHYVQIITPNMLFLLQMSLVVAMAVIGGIENFVAAAIGAIILQVVLALLRNSFVIGGVEVDMTIWRLVFFGILLMITLRFFRNGLIAPIIAYFRREGMAEETVAKRASTVTGPGGGPHRTEAPE